MNLITMCLIFTNVLLLGIGQVLFKISSTQASRNSGNWLLGLISWQTFAALAVYAAATLVWMSVLRTVPISKAYPYVGLAFIIVPLMANVFLKEPIGWNLVAGAVLIGLGIWVSAMRFGS